MTKQGFRTHSKQQWMQFRERWRLVAEADREELRNTPLDRKFRQLAILMQSAQGAGWRVHTEAEVNLVRERWRRLREASRG